MYLIYLKVFMYLLMYPVYFSFCILPIYLYVLSTSLNVSCISLFVSIFLYLLSLFMYLVYLYLCLLSLYLNFFIFLCIMYISVSIISLSLTLFLSLPLCRRRRRRQCHLPGLNFVWQIEVIDWNEKPTKSRNRSAHIFGGERYTETKREGKGIGRQMNNTEGEIVARRYLRSRTLTYLRT